MSYWIQNRLKSLDEAFSTKYCCAIAYGTAIIARKFQTGNKLLICGNGGSAPDFVRQDEGEIAIAVYSNQHKIKF